MAHALLLERKDPRIVLASVPSCSPSAPQASSDDQRHLHSAGKDTSDMTESVSESENPAIPSPTSEVPRPRTNHDWWPNQLDLSVLHRHSTLSDPMGEAFDYAEE